MAIGIVQTGIMFFLFSRFISWPPLFEAFYIDTPSVHAGLVFFGMLFSPINFFLGIGMQLLSRKNEYEADEFAAKTTADGSAMIEALKKLSAHNLSNLGPHPLYVFLHYSHPPIVERVRAIERIPGYNGRPSEA
jgi:STE24 endopeptidase